MANQASPKTYTEAELQETVDIKVSHNNETKTFTLLRLLLTTHAAGFARIFQNKSVHAVQLNDVSIIDMEVFMGWLQMEYFRYFSTHRFLNYLPGGHPQWIIDREKTRPCADDLNPLYWTKDDEDVWEYAEVAVDMYILAENFDIPRLRQDAIDRLLWCHNKVYNDHLIETFLPMSIIKRAYEHTKEGSKLRKILVDGWGRV